jgi:hypothetical protein
MFETTSFFKTIGVQFFWRKMADLPAAGEQSISTFAIFFICDRVAKGELTLEWCSTLEMVGDFYDEAATRHVISEISGHHHGSRPFRRHNNTSEHIVRFGAPGTGAPQECIGNTKGTKP